MHYMTCFLVSKELNVDLFVESDILHVDAAGSSIIIVNSWKAAYDLFEKKSSLYSSRYVHLRLYAVRVRFTSELLHASKRAENQMVLL